MSKLSFRALVGALCLCLLPQIVLAASARPAGPLPMKPVVLDDLRPIVIDGVEYAAGELEPEFLAGLIYVEDRFSDADHAIYAFTSHEALDAYLRVAHGQRLVFETNTPMPTRQVGAVANLCPQEPVLRAGVGGVDNIVPECDPGGGGGGGGTGGGGTGGGTGPCYDTIAYFYEHINYGGSNMTVTAGQSVNIGSSSWNDKISSLRSAGLWTVLYKDQYWGGTEKWIEGCRSISSLHTSTWNFGDQTSAIRVYPQ